MGQLHHQLTEGAVSGFSSWVFSALNGSVSFALKFRCVQNVIARFCMFSSNGKRPSSARQALLGVFLWTFRVLGQNSVWRTSIGCSPQEPFSNPLSGPQTSLPYKAIGKNYIIKYFGPDSNWNVHVE